MGVLRLERKRDVAKEDRVSRLTDPRYCIEEANRLIIPVNEDNWDQVSEDAASLNVLQAAIAHLHYTDADSLPEDVMRIVFTAYLLGRNADDRRPVDAPEAFRAFIEDLDLSGL